MKVIGVALVLVVLASCGPMAAREPDSGAHGLSARLVREIERRVDMPPGANALHDYNRYYSQGIDPNTIEAVFLLRSVFADGPDGAVPVRGIPNAYAVERLPIIFDGMCAVVNAEFYLPAMGLSSFPSRNSMAPEREAQNVQCGGI